MAYARFSAFRFFYRPDRARPYARFSAFRFFYCTDQDGPTRVFMTSAFSTARTGPALRAFFCLSLFLPPGPGLPYARFSAFRFFYRPDRAELTRVLLPSAFSTARTGPALRAFFCLPPFLLPGPGRPYARFLIFSFFYCPERDGPTRVFLSFAFSTALTGSALRAFYCLSPFLPPGPGLTYSRFSAFRLFYCPDRAGVTRVFLSLAFSTARTGPALRAFSYLPLFLPPGPGPDRAGACFFQLKA